MRRPDFGTVECAICGEEAEKNGPRQATCGKLECRDLQRRATQAASLARKKKRGRGELPPVPRRGPKVSAPLARALADVVLATHDRKHNSSFRTLTNHVRLAADAVRVKDRRAYRDALHALVHWGLAELVRVRLDDDATGS